MKYIPNNNKHRAYKVGGLYMKKAAITFNEVYTVVSIREKFLFEGAFIRALTVVTQQHDTALSIIRVYKLYDF